MLIDLPADTYSHFFNNNIDGDKIKYLFVTHPHSDHFYPTELSMHHGCYAHDMRAERLKTYASRGACDTLNAFADVAEFDVDFEVMHPFTDVTLDKYTVTALPARHHEGDGALFYIISDGVKTILYAHDKGFFHVYETQNRKNNKNRIRRQTICLNMKRCFFIP